MARLPDYRAQRGLDTGSAQQLSVDTSRLQRLGEFGRAVEEAGQTALKITTQRAEQDAKGEAGDLAKRQAELERKRGKTEAYQQQQQFNAQMDNALDEVTSAAPANGHGIFESFKNDVLDVGARTLLDQIPENEQVLFQERLAKDVDLFEQKAAMRERDQGIDYGVQVVEARRDQMLNEVLPESFDTHVQRLLEVAEAAPLPANLRAQMVDEVMQTSRFKAARNGLFGDVVIGLEPVLD
ncbi:hypothetical protein [Pararhizobium sp. IMCC21322]|uniref:hypothetical protein n=1 Tax=Pararhizobium sp. IMCC21322 TaxID=3067903 RepID=UPI002741243D|nr:hypothetical protein [Pararhizobium sp. IMCC21322]